MTFKLSLILRSHFKRKVALTFIKGFVKNFDSQVSLLFKLEIKIIPNTTDSISLLRSNYTSLSCLVLQQLSVQLSFLQNIYLLYGKQGLHQTLIKYGEPILLNHHHQVLEENQALGYILFFIGEIVVLGYMNCMEGIMIIYIWNICKLPYDVIDLLLSR